MAEVAYGASQVGPAAVNAPRTAAAASGGGGQRRPLDLGENAETGCGGGTIAAESRSGNAGTQAL